jgi:actin beta/gamma 1
MEEAYHSTEDFNPHRTVIFDIGSTFAKVGAAQDGQPSVVFPSMVGHPRHKPVASGMGQKDWYVGDEVSTKRAILDYEFPVQRGLIADWNYMEKIWFHSFYNELRCAPEEHPLIMLEHPLTPKDAREKTVQLMFETFQVPALFFANPAVASLRAVGRTSGVVLCSGGQTTYSMVVDLGEGIMSTLNTLDIGAQDIGDSLMKYLSSKHEGRFNTSSERFIVTDICKTLGHIVLDYDSELQKPQNDIARQYEFPDGWTLQLHHELFSHNEVMFKPELYGIEKGGIHHMIHNSIKKCDADIHAELLNNIVLSGGNTLTHGLDARLIKELKVLVPEHAEHVRIESNPHGLSRRYLPFCGAAALAVTLSQDDWMLKAEYDEIGPSMVHSRCPIGVF